MSTYRVAAGTQVHHDGQTYTAGETFEAYPAEAALWLLQGWVVEVERAGAAAKKVAAKKAAAGVLPRQKVSKAAGRGRG
ncbi:MAG: hypothetical protein M3042_12090 [Actinomycetota bacterium]|nr:hypothetical protein [Actinomycetota bacterium]